MSFLTIFDVFTQFLPSPSSAGLNQRCLNPTSFPLWRSWRSVLGRWWQRRSTCAWRANQRWTVRTAPYEMSSLCCVETCMPFTRYSSATSTITGWWLSELEERCCSHLNLRLIFWFTASIISFSCVCQKGKVADLSRPRCRRTIQDGGRGVHLLVQITCMGSPSFILL